MERDQRAEADAAGETMRGQVEDVADSGLLVGGRWWQYGPDLAVPALAKGQLIELEGRDGRISKVVVLATPGATAPGPPDLLPMPVEAPAVARGRLERRLALLTAAATFLAPRLEVTAEEVVRVATAWETWVLGDEDSGVR